MTDLKALVSPLTWSDVREPNEQIRYHYVIAENALGAWTIEWEGWKDYDSPVVYLNGEFVGHGQDLESAKAAAEAENIERSLAPLDLTKVEVLMDDLQYIANGKMLASETPSEAIQKAIYKAAAALAAMKGR